MHVPVDTKAHIVMLLDYSSENGKIYTVTHQLILLLKGTTGMELCTY